MALNTSYAEQVRGFAGMLSDSRIEKHAETYVQGEASAGIAFGVAVAEGDASTVAGTPDDAINLVDANSKVAGVVIHSHNFDRLNQLNTDGTVKPTNLISVLKKGQILMPFEGTTCTKGAIAYVRHTANGGNTTIGGVAAGAGTGLTLQRGFTFGETLAAANADGCVLVDVDISNADAVVGLT